MVPRPSKKGAGLFASSAGAAAGGADFESAAGGAVLASAAGAAVSAARAEQGATTTRRARASERIERLHRGRTADYTRGPKAVKGCLAEDRDLLLGATARGFDPSEVDAGCRRAAGGIRSVPGDVVAAGAPQGFRKDANETAADVED